MHEPAGPKSAAAAVNTPSESGVESEKLSRLLLFACTSSTFWFSDETLMMLEL